MSSFENGEAYINHMDKAQSNGTFAALSCNKARYIQNSLLLDLVRIGQIFRKVLVVILL